MDELTGLVEYAPTPVLVADRPGEVTRANDLAGALFGQDADALVGRALDDLLATSGSTDLAGSLGAVTSAGGPQHLGADAEVHVSESGGDGVHGNDAADGTDAADGDRGGDGPVPVDLRADLVEPDDGPERYVLVLSEVSTRERRLSELRASEERYRRLLEVSPAPIVIYDAEGRIRYANQAAADLVDEDGPGDVVGRSALSYVHPEEREDASAQMGATAADREVVERIERRLLTADGETCHTVLSSVPVTYEGEPAAQVVMSDVTPIKEREQALATQNERLDRFASIVSHDLRNPLSVLRSSLELAAETDDPEHVERGIDAVDRMEELLEDLLTLARQGERPTDITSVSLADVAAAAWRTVETGDASLAVQAEGTVQADEGRLRELFENLFRNAVEHGSTSPPSHDREDAIEHGGNAVTVTVETTEGGFAVADDGRGIPADEREAVFEDGYSTSDRGTGLGLTIVEEIAEAHGWTVDVTESEDGGARFEFTT